MHNVLIINHNLCSNELDKSNENEEQLEIQLDRSEESRK